MTYLFKPTEDQIDLFLKQLLNKSVGIAGKVRYGTGEIDRVLDAQTSYMMGYLCSFVKEACRKSDNICDVILKGINE